MYHEGEIEVQSRAGVRTAAERLEGGIRSTIPEVARDFIAQQPFIVVASVDADDRVWASILDGKPGFVSSIDEKSILIQAQPGPSDPLFAALQPGSYLGLLSMDFSTRRRMRLNGIVTEIRPGSFRIDAQEVFSNCPKYIQARKWVQNGMTDLPEKTTMTSDSLSVEQQDWISEADTFFIASTHARAGADASHRGGNPGFVKIINERTIFWDDYAGNNMFQTLGNLARNPAVGLLFVDFQKGTTLQLSGRGVVKWKQQAEQGKSGTDRAVQIEIERVIETQTALSLNWIFENYSPVNP